MATPAERVLSVAVAGAAAWRLVRLWQVDEISDPARARVQRRWPARNAILNASVVDAGVVRRVDAPPSQGWTMLPDASGAPAAWMHTEGTWLGRLLACPWCLSVWAAAGCLAAGRRGPAAAAVNVMAAAGVAAVVAARVDPQRWGLVSHPVSGGAGQP